MKINVKRILAGLLIFCIILSFCYQSLASEGELPESIGEEHIELVEDIPTEEESHTDESETENEPVVPDENLEVTEGSEEQENVDAPINDEIEESIELYFNENVGVSQVAVNAYHALVLFKNGDLYSMGNNQFGQLGNGYEDNSSMVVVTPIATNIVQIAAGKFHSLALTSEGKVLSWGQNTYGQLGRDSYETFYPHHVQDNTGVELDSIVKIAAGTFHSMALDEDGRVITFGYNVQGQLGNKSELESDVNLNYVIDGNDDELNNIVDIKSGPYHCVALSQDGHVYTWGQGNYGRLGVGSIRNYRYAVMVQTGDDGVPLTNVTKIGAGSFHTMAVTNDNNIYCWGKNNMGQLGVGDTEDRYYATMISEFDAGEDCVLNVTGGDNHTIILMGNGEVYATGGNDYGQLCKVPAVEQDLSVDSVWGVSDIVQISSASNQIMAVHQNGKVYCWGNNNKGQYGNLGIGIYRVSTEMIVDIGVYNDTHGNTFDTATQLTADQYESGVIDYNDDIDVFIFSPEVSGDYIFDISGDYSVTKNIRIYDLSSLSEIPYVANEYYFMESGKSYAIEMQGDVYYGYSVAVISGSKTFRIIQSAYLLGLDGEVEINEITSGFVKGLVEVRNGANIAKSLVVIMTLYDGDNALYDIRTVESDVEPFTNTKVTCGFNVPDDHENYRIVLSVWDNLTDMNYLVEDFVLE